MHQRLVGQYKVDVIGDIHGCYDGLVQLLERMGYELVEGAYQHPERLAIFVGDLIDRGPKIREVLQLTYAMWTRGSALIVLGNHEYNAVRFSVEIDDFLAKKNTDGLPLNLQRLMSKTLQQFSDHENEWRAYTRWFACLPLFLEGEAFRVVHACWDATMIEQYRRQYSVDHLPEEFIAASKQPDSFEGCMVDRLTRGTSLPLPEGMKIESKDGFIRHFFRTKFWAKSPKTYGDVIFQPDPIPFDLHEKPIHNDHKDNLVDYPVDAAPVFFGHYWLKGRPKPLLDNVACLDYSAVNYGRLTAYQFDGERTLTPDKFVWVYIDPVSSDTKDSLPRGKQ